MQKPTSTNGRRIAAAVFLGAASTAMVAGTAHADGVKGATVDSHDRSPGEVVMTDGVEPTTLIGLKAGDASELWTYCIQETVELNSDETYDEHAWSEESGRTGIDDQHLEGIKWILNNSYPQLSVGRLASAAKIPGHLSSVEAVEATQAAIWTYADPRGELTLDTDHERDAKVIALYKYLVGAAAGHLNDSDQPKASLSISAPATAAPGAKVAFRLNSPTTPGSFISVALSAGDDGGARLVDAAGQAIAPNALFKNGDVVYVQLPATPNPGSVTLTASGTVSGIETGRVFVSSDGKPSQNLILAQAQNAPVSATATVSWKTVTTPTTPSSSPSTAPSSHPGTTPSTPTSAATPSAPATPSSTASTPTGGLAHTGADDTVPLAGGALALLAVGGGMVVYTRRGKRQGTHS